MRTRRSPQAITFARLSALVPVSESSTCVLAATTFLCRYPSRPGNMIHLSDPDAAARHGPADKVFDGLGMLAGIIGANTINVCGCGVEPQPQRPPAETSNVEPDACTLTALTTDRGPNDGASRRLPFHAALRRGKAAVRTCGRARRFGCPVHGQDVHCRRDAPRSDFEAACRLRWFEELADIE